MTSLHALLYGFIQGISEFLPISSSAHLAILPYILEIEDPGIVFDLAMHLGTLMAVILYFFKDIEILLRSFFSLLRSPSSYRQHHFCMNFIISTISTIIFAFLVKDSAESFGRHPQFIACNLIIFGLLMGVGDKFSPEDKDRSFRKDLSLKDSFIIGFSQVIALFPGVSRSGIILTSSRLLNYTRLEATRFSFLLSIPLIVGGCFLKVSEVLNRSETFDLTMIFIGIISSFIVGIFTIHLFLKIIERVDLMSFAIYRVCLGVLLFFL